MQDATQKSRRFARAVESSAGRAAQDVQDVQGLKTAESLAWVAWLILLLAGACRGEESRAQQARALLERIAAMDLRAPPDQRARQIEQLRALPLADAQLVRVRDACSAAHAGLLSAEREQEAVRRKLDQVSDAGLEQAELAGLSAAIARAGERLRAAHTALPDCEQKTRELLEQYR